MSSSQAHTRRRRRRRRACRSTHPCWLVRTRMQTQAMHSELPAAMRQLGMLATFKHIYRAEGVLAFWNGLSASFLGLGHVAIQVRPLVYVAIQICALWQLGRCATVLRCRACVPLLAMRVGDWSHDCA
jgi:Mitochondrial carrier protein